MRPYQEQGRNRDGHAVEDGRRHLAAAPFYLLFIVGHALSRRHHVVDDDDLFPREVPRDAVIPFEDAVLAPFGLVQALARAEYLHIVKPRCQLRPTLADIPVEPLETAHILALVTARHEHDMIGLVLRLKGVHARLEEPDAVYLAVLEAVEVAAESPLFPVEQVAVPRRIIEPVENHPYAVRLERSERLLPLEERGTGKGEHPAGVPMARHHGQTAVTVALPGGIGLPRGGKRHLAGLPSPEPDDRKQETDKAAQNHKPNSCFHHDAISPGRREHSLAPFRAGISAPPFRLTCLSDYNSNELSFNRKS